MMAYYNEVDPYAAQWLRNLIEAGHIAPGIVDERSIEDVRPNDIREFTQCHFFAGIGVWSLALRRAGWRDDQSVWTGSCPCQPFSAAGKGNGFADERHLWPSWFHLITQCQPDQIFGEQVASKDADTWIDLVQTDLEAMGYAVGAVPFPSASVGAPQVRDRLYWMADAHLSDGARQRPISIPMEPEQKTDRRGKFDCWQGVEFIRCTDGKSRPIKSSIQPLATGNSRRVGRLRAYGGSINAQQAQIFIESYLTASTTRID